MSTRHSKWKKKIEEIPGCHGNRGQPETRNPKPRKGEVEERAGGQIYF